MASINSLTCEEAARLEKKCGYNQQMNSSVIILSITVCEKHSSFQAMTNWQRCEQCDSAGKTILFHLISI